MILPAEVTLQTASNTCSSVVADTKTDLPGFIHISQVLTAKTAKLINSKGYIR